MDRLPYLEKIFLKAALKKDSTIMNIGVFFAEAVFLLFGTIFLWLYFLKGYPSILICSLYFIFLFLYILTIRTYKSIIKNLKQEIDKLSKDRQVTCNKEGFYS